MITLSPVVQLFAQKIEEKMRLYKEGYWLVESDTKEIVQAMYEAHNQMVIAMGAKGDIEKVNYWALTVAIDAMRIMNKLGALEEQEWNALREDRDDFQKKYEELVKRLEQTIAFTKL